MRRRFGIATSIAIGVLAILALPPSAASEEATRRERIAASPNFEGGKARNQVERKSVGLGVMLGAAGEWVAGRQHRKPGVEIPVVHPEPRELLPQGRQLRATWLGHSTVLLEVDGQLLLTDPVLSERSSPVSFAGPKRFHPAPLEVDELPRLDAVLLSHDHYDHLDHATVLALAETPVPFVVPLGVGSWLERWGVDPDRIVELDWWEETEVGDLRVVCTPSHHFSGRDLLLRDRTLWSSFAILGPEHRVWFSGDTGPLDAAPAIAERLGPFDLSLIEIGAWDPAWADIHLGPDAAAALHGQIGAEVMMPVHYGSFEMALHAWDQPVVRILQLAEEQDIALLAPIPGQTVSPDEPGVAAFWQERAP